ncbi:MAG: hypothetical protein H6Q15_1129 [Bacteroidetes bacterium]|nr:hypothetical protein [Bacteroidota bacterium]
MPMKKLIIITLILVSINTKSFAHGGAPYFSFDYGQSIMSNNKFGFRSFNPSISTGFLLPSYGLFESKYDGVVLLGVGTGLNYSNWNSSTNKSTSFNNYQVPLFLRIRVAYPNFILTPYCGLDIGANINFGTNVKGDYLETEYYYNRGGLLFNPSIGILYVFKRDKFDAIFDTSHIFAQLSWNNNVMYYGVKDSPPHIISYLELKVGITASLW